MEMTALEKQQEKIDADRQAKRDRMRAAMPFSTAIYEDMRKNFGELEFFGAQENGHAINIGLGKPVTGTAVKPTSRNEIPDAAPNNRRAKANGADVRAGATSTVPQGFSGMARQQLLSMVGLQKGG